MNGGPRVKINSPVVEGVFGNLADFAGDVATLAELQAKLASHDLKETISRATIPVGAIMVGGVLALGTIPVLLIGVGELLGPLLGLSHGGSMLAVAILALVLATAMLLFAMPALKRSFASFQRSREELVRNIAWIKTVLTYSGR
jgi:hypothetical protein